MSQNDNLGTESEKLIALFVAFAAASLAAPVLLPKVGEAITRWVLEHHVLVRPNRALFPIPGLDAGPDLRRLLIAAAVLLAVVFVGRVVARAVADRKAT